MGGKKKLSLKQMERMQMRKDEEEKKRKEKAAAKEKKLAGVLIPDIKSEKMLEELKRMRVLTPYAVASRFNIRISTAKDFLEQLENNGIIQLVSGDHNIKIYKAVD